MTACVRRAWLTLGALSLPLEDETAGYFCQSLDLGSPDIRDQTSSRPNADGIDDQTMFMGGRAVVAEVSALAGAGARIDAVASAFDPFMVPSARPVLHYVLDRPGAAERTLTLRAAGHSWPIAGPYQRDIHLQWVASDPYAYEPNDNTAAAWFGTPTETGRTYTDPYYVRHGRDYGNIQEAGPSVAYMLNGGDVPAYPMLRVYGPVSAPVITMGGGAGQVRTTPDFRVDAADYVTIDSAKHLAYRGDNPDDSVISWIDFQNTAWPVLPPHTNTYLWPTGQDYTHVSQVTATWRNGFLS